MVGGGLSSKRAYSKGPARTLRGTLAFIVRGTKRDILRGALRGGLGICYMSISDLRPVLSADILSELKDTIIVQSRLSWLSMEPSHRLYPHLQTRRCGSCSFGHVGPLEACSLLPLNPLNKISLLQPPYFRRLKVRL